jgi:catechol 2,3-dioxygenase-like lactoylglutathione lyase family enzyme
MKILFVASIAIVSANPPESRKLFVDALGLPLQKHEADEYYFSEEIAGSRHFGVWPLSQAAEACFGTTEWPAGRPIPQTCIEFEVEDEAAVHGAGQELEARGFTLLHPARMEPWGQTVVRVITGEGVIIGVSFAPWLHNSA